MQKKSSLLKEEILKFEAMADDWWDPSGKFKPLHDITPTRLEFIVSKVEQYLCKLSFKDISVIDIGCGGGLIAEPLARLGFKVTGIDASKVNIDIAKKHAENLNINYINGLAEDLVKEKKKFDLVLALEILEHVDNVDIFIKDCFRLLNKGGILILSTMNRTAKSFIQSILIAEYVLKWLPIGTHSWNKFLKPAEINKHANGKLLEMCGIKYSVFDRSWKIVNDIDNNYFLVYGL